VRSVSSLSPGCKKDDVKMKITGKLWGLGDVGRVIGVIC